MTPREVLNSPSIRMVVYAVLIGIAWGELRMSVAQKADRAELIAAVENRNAKISSLSDSVKMADSEQMTEIAGMAADIKTIKLILCQKAAADSYCHGR